MNLPKIKPKILAPVGSFEMLAAALNAGADEIYFGVGSLNMRVGAKANFNLTELSEIVKRCKEFDVKTNLTLNTVMFDEDLAEVKETIKAAKLAGVDNVIAMDLAVILESFNQGLEVHASVQAGITNIEAVKHYAKYCDRVVLARECDLNQQAKIVQEINRQKITGPKGNLVEVEVFAHGALCVSISGKCGMSLLANNKSANRGKCLQPCRRKYEIKDLETGQKFDVENEYVMSSGDLATIGFLDQLIKAGVMVLKIEGRGKNPEYVDMTVKIYKKALDAVWDGSFGPEKIKTWQKDLEKVYNRKLTEGYYLGKSVKEWSGSYGSLATEKKLFVGEVSHVFKKSQILELKVLSTEFSLNQELLIIGTVSGVSRMQVLEIRNEAAENVEAVEKGRVYSFKPSVFPAKVKQKDKIYLIQKK